VKTYKGKWGVLNLKRDSKMCVKCFLPVECYKVPLDGSGVCAYCNTIEQFKHQVSMIGNREELLAHRLQLFREKGRYDCIVGFSGGKDSSYLLYKLQHHYKARVLSYTLDNGYLTPYAKENIQKLMNNLGIDHLWVSPPTDILHEFYRANMLVEGWPCSACFHLMSTSAWKLAFKYGIPFIINGRTPEQILRNPTPEMFDSNNSLLFSSFLPYDYKRTKLAALNSVNESHKFKQWLLQDKSYWSCAQEYLYVDPEEAKNAEVSPELLAFFLYEPYNEKEITITLERNTSWRPPHDRRVFSHADCGAHRAAGYLYNRIIGTPFLTLELSASIRLGSMPPKEAMLLLENEKIKVSQFPQDSVADLSKMCRMSERFIKLLPVRVRMQNALRCAHNKANKLLRKGAAV